MTELGRIVIYTKRVQAMVDFYTTYFGYGVSHDPEDRIIELTSDGNGVDLLLHPAAKGQREGQSIVKLVFDVPDVEEFCRQARAKGLQFGPIHKADGYSFANARDPCGNSISISSRAFRG